MKRIKQLDSMRFFMCIIIFIGHCTFLSNYSYGWIYNKYLSNSRLSLDFFFMLSGFGLYISAYRKGYMIEKYNVINCIKFAIVHIRKIYPLYIFSLLMYLPLNFLRLKRYLVEFAIGTTLCQSLAPTTSISHLINGVCWFLSALFIAYILCPIFYKIIEKVKNNGLILLAFFNVGIIAIVCELADKYADGMPFNVLRFEFTFDLGSTPYSTCWIVFIGMVLGKIYMNIEEIKLGKFEIPVTAAAILYYFLRKTIAVSFFSRAFCRILDIIIVCLLILVLANGTGKLSLKLKSDTFVRLGNYSMYIYLLHYPMIAYTGGVFKHFKIYFGNMTGVVQLILAIFGTAVIVAVYLWGTSLQLLDIFKADKI